MPFIALLQAYACGLFLLISLRKIRSHDLPLFYFLHIARLDCLCWLEPVTLPFTSYYIRDNATKRDFYLQVLTIEKTYQLPPGSANQVIKTLGVLISLCPSPGVRHTAWK